MRSVLKLKLKNQGANYKMLKTIICIAVGMAVISYWFLWKLKKEADKLNCKKRKK